MDKAFNTYELSGKTLRSGIVSRIILLRSAT